MTLVLRAQRLRRRRVVGERLTDVHGAAVQKVLKGLGERLAFRHGITRQALVAQALPNGGALIVYDPLIDDARSVEAHGLLSSLNMLIETKGGSEYTGAECMNWLQQAGFRETYIEPLGDVHTAVIGFK